MNDNSFILSKTSFRFRKDLNPRSTKRYSEVEKMRFDGFTE